MRCSPLGPLEPASHTFTVLSLAPVQFMIVFIEAPRRSSSCSTSAIARAYLCARCRRFISKGNSLPDLGKVLPFAEKDIEPLNM